MPLFSKYSDQQFEQLQTERDTVRGERDAALGKSAALQEENELLLAQLHQVQEELESFFLKSKQFEEAASQAAAKLKAETDAKNAEAGKAQAEAAKAKDLQEENDLLLAQLHQVQEELERYYLKNKDLESSVGEVTTSLRNARYALINAKLTGTLAPQTLLPSN